MVKLPFAIYSHRSNDCIVLKFVENIVPDCGVGLIGSGYGAVVGFCEPGYELTGFIKD